MAKDEPKRRSIIGTLVDNKLTEREDDSTINITYVGRRSINGLCSLAAKAGSKFSASELLTAYKDIEKQAKEEVYSGATVEFGFANNSLESKARDRPRRRFRSRRQPRGYALHPVGRTPS